MKYLFHPINYFVLLLTLVGCQLSFLDLSEELKTESQKSKTELPKPYRIIYNMDSSDIIANSKDVDHYLTGIFEFLNGSHVDALFWHDGAGGNTANYDSAVLELTGERVGNVNPFLQKLIAEGNDPPKIVVAAAKRLGIDVFYSFRINDCHDSFGHERLLATFKIQHPEWTIGKGQVYGGHQNLNFAVAEVRDLKFDVIKEIFEKYEFDGLEIDFLRSPPYFMPGQEVSNAPLLTQFLRRVRRHLISRGKEQGRVITLAVRVDENMEACRLDGFDVATWIQEELIDILILGSGAIDIEVEEFKKLTTGSNVLVYPCLYGWPSNYSPISPDMARALAMNYWYQGADGIYTFNWNAHTNAHRPQKHSKWAYQRPLLREIDDVRAMQGKNKRFAADRGQPMRQYPHNWSHCRLPVQLETGERVDVPITVGEDFTRSSKPKQIVLVINCAYLADGDELTIKLNQRKLSPLLHEGSQINVSVEANWLDLGKNQVEVTVDKGEVTLEAIEIEVVY